MRIARGATLSSPLYASRSASANGYTRHAERVAESANGDNRDIVANIKRVVIDDSRTVHLLVDRIDIQCACRMGSMILTNSIVSAVVLGRKGVNRK